MSDKTHCDGCDLLIPATVQRLRVRAGLWTGDHGSGTGNDDDFDFCVGCVQKNPALKRIRAALVDEADVEEQARLNRIATAVPPARRRA